MINPDNIPITGAELPDLGTASECVIFLDHAVLIVSFQYDGTVEVLEELYEY